MLRLKSGRFGWMLFLVLGLWSVTAQAEQFRYQHHWPEKYGYQYVSLDQFVPEGYAFFDPVAINDRGQVFGTIYDESFTYSVAVYADGNLEILQPGFAIAANNRGTVGGGVVIDSASGQTQAALFHRDRVELIPLQPGETSNEVITLNNWGITLVRSYDASGSTIYSLYRRGRFQTLNLDSSYTPEYLNDRGMIAGTISGPDTLGFRFDPATGETTLLYPLPSDPDVYIQGINNRGDVLGYSYINSGRESIGVWDRSGNFRTYFVQGIPEFPAISNSLRFNDNNLIVISAIRNPSGEQGKSYLVPKPGGRLYLPGMVKKDKLPLQIPLSNIVDINNRGSMIGYSADKNFSILDNFLLIRSNNRHH